MENEKITETQKVHEFKSERLGLETHFVATSGVVLLSQAYSTIGLTLDQLIEIGEWAERIKSEANGEPQSNQDFPPIPEGWERFTTLEEWRGGEWKCWQPYCEAWSKAQNVTGLGLSASRLPKMAVAQYYIQRVKE